MIFQARTREGIRAPVPLLVLVVTSMSAVVFIGQAQEFKVTIRPIRPIRPHTNSTTTHSPTTEASTEGPSLCSEVPSFCLNQSEFSVAMPLPCHAMPFLVHFKTMFSPAVVCDVKYGTHCKYAMWPDCTSTLPAFYRDYNEVLAAQYPETQVGDFVYMLSNSLDCMTRRGSPFSSKPGSIRSYVVFSYVAEAEHLLEAIETEPHLLLGSNFTSTYGVAGIANISDVGCEKIVEKKTYVYPPCSSSAFSQLRTVQSLVHAAAFSVGIFLADAMR